jgi:CHAD domain-containing protein/CYTH domain-containing protein
MTGTDPSQELLDQPPEAAARILVLAVLEEAASAASHLNDDGNSEALHDFRVALRRCRSLLRAYRPLLADSVSKKQRRALRDLAASTTSARDTEVQLAWLGAQSGQLRPSDRTAWSWLIKRLEARRGKAYGEVRGEILRRFNELAPKLKKGLSHYIATVDHVASHRTLAAVASALVGDAGDELHAALALVTSPADVEAAHEARILAKRLRYLLEPLKKTAVGEDAGALVKSMKGLQDVLGELHDAHVLAAEVASALIESATERVQHLHNAIHAEAPDEAETGPGRDLRAGLLSVDRLIRDRVHTLYRSLEAHWLKERFEPFRAQLNEFAAALFARGNPHVEIERKYLLRSMPPLEAKISGSEINQGWIPGDEIHERLRRVDSGSASRFYRTIKTGTGIQRMELEDETKAAVFERLWPLTEGQRVRKRRYKVKDGIFVWEIDEFLDRDLFLAEVELPTAETPVEVPAWLAPFVVREVTGESQYVNQNLAR